MISTVLASLDFGFLGGSMGEVVGEKVALAADLAASRAEAGFRCKRAGEVVFELLRTSGDDG